MATLTIDDVFSEVEELALRDKRSVREIVSELAQKALESDRAKVRDFPFIPVSSRGPLTLEMVNHMRDEDA